VTRPRTALIVSPYFPPHLGGVEQYVMNIGRLLQSEHGWRVIVATSSSNGNAGSFVDSEAGLLVHELPTQLRISNTPVGFSWHKDLQSILEREHVDLVDAHAPVPYMAEIALLAGRRLPFVLTYHAGRAHVRDGLRAAVMRLHQATVLPSTARRATEIICSSDSVANEFSAAFMGRRVTTISPGVDPERFPMTPVPRAQRILFVGSLLKATAYKGLPALLEAFATVLSQIPDAVLEIVGDGNERSSYEQRCRDLGIQRHVTFAGHLSGSRLTDAYRRCTVLALPTKYDSFPTVLVEAMSSGRPVVSTRVGGIPSLVDEGVTGFLVDPSDGLGFSQHLIQLLLDHELASEIGLAANARVHRTLTWRSRADLTHEVFDRVLKSRTDSRKTIAIVTPYSTPNVGGVEQYAERITNAIAAEPDLRALLITTSSNGGPRSVEADDNLTTIRLRTVARLSNTPVNPMWALQLRRIFKRYGVDVVTTHAPVPLFADTAIAVAGRRPIVETYHSGSMVKGVKWIDPVLRLYERHVLPRSFARANALVAVSPASLAFSYGGSVIIPPGVDVDAFVPRRRTQRDTRPPHALYVGRMDRTSRWKGVDVLIHALCLIRHEIPGATVRLVGGGDDVSRLMDLAAHLELSDAVEFSGVLRGDELVAAYQEATVLVLPSLTESESFGMALIEAMACGTPVIGSRVGGIPFVVTHDHDGLLVTAGDALELAEALTRLFQDASLRTRLGQAGRRTAESRFSWNMQVEKHLELIRNVLVTPRAEKS
jgi:glycosyltransferase involved in cell wall biosynthesis